MIHVAEEVRRALSGGAAVVALETAVLTHGLPRPANTETYQEMLAAVRAEGAVPAPVAVWKGRVRAGLGDEEVQALGRARDVPKAGLADLPALAARGGHGGTTVAATLWAARRAGIPVFATGGIGGVHRGWADTLDVSGDLAALGRYGGCVVCSGAKAVLDLPCTLEALETLGVTVLGYRTGAFPAFVCADSGLGLRHRVETPEEAAAVVRARDALGLPQGVVVANPPPAGHALSRERLEAALAGLGSGRGPEVTPRLLRALAEATGGASVAANRALLVANARLAARIARCLAGGAGAGPGP